MADEIDIDQRVLSGLRAGEAELPATATQSRIDELASKANQGTITDSEREEYAEFVEYIELVGIIKAKARLILKKRTS